MAHECHLCLLGLIFLSSLLTGISGVNGDHVFISSGENVRLPCNNALHGCKSTTWTYNRFSHSSTVELITLGIKKKDTESHERLSLGSDCSLNIKNITKEDYGFYTCRQYVNGQQQGDDARVYLHVLHVSSSSSQTEISAGSSVSLSCQLYSSYGVSCDDSGRYEGVDLLWVNQAGDKLKISDSRYQISAPGHCISTLTTTLLNEDDNREWRCEVTQGDQVKTSVTYTVKISAQDKMTVITAISVSVAVFAVFLLVALWLICRKRADNKRGIYESVVKNENYDKGMYETINMFIPAAARDNEQTDDVTYSEVSSSGKKPVKSLASALQCPLLQSALQCPLLQSEIYDKGMYETINMSIPAAARDNCSVSAPPERPELPFHSPLFHSFLNCLSCHGPPNSLLHHGPPNSLLHHGPPNGLLHHGYLNCLLRHGSPSSQVCPGGLPCLPQLPASSAPTPWTMDHDGATFTAVWVVRSNRSHPNHLFAFRLSLLTSRITKSPDLDVAYTLDRAQLNNSGVLPHPPPSEGGWQDSRIMDTVCAHQSQVTVPYESSRRHNNLISRCHCHQTARVQLCLSVFHPVIFLFPLLSLGIGQQNNPRA
ncbi:hypothetical protein QQF64_025936 [Cirrhinus molitorella]|uniref:Ig-like domain-containing protein n=1 Tax=Cirrhinus molitorella TaxID=172907 RepID=A0ABR3NRI0_9TELE